MKQPLVELEDVHKYYQRGPERIHVLDGLELEIAESDFLALMGPSGSGKSTLLNIIGGLDRVDRGEVRIGNEAISALSSRALAAWRNRCVGFVFQSYNLMPMLSAVENVAVPLMLGSLAGSARRRSAEIALELVGMADRAHHRPDQLSGGQQQRVAIARALVTDPALLICDEPTGDLDFESATRVLELLGELNREHGKTIVMVTHDARAAGYARRTLSLSRGHLGTVAAPGV